VFVRDKEEKYMFIIGHQRERERLAFISKKETMSQSYLFFGPQSVGKSLCALEFASLLVSEPDFEPSEEKPYPFDVTILRPEEETKRGVTKQKSIGVEEIREALSFLSHFPTKGRFRVLIIEDAHKLSLSAQNVLLKTLEEPNPSSVIILVTHEVGNIISTILSRVERVRFRYVDAEEIASRSAVFFSNNNHDQKIAPFFFSLGRPGMIKEISSNPQKFALKQEKLSRLFRLSSLSISERLTLAEELSKNVPEMIRLFEWWLPGLHKQATEGRSFSQTKQFFRLLEDTEHTLFLLKTTQSNARLLAEKLFLSL